jgi:hypothetical protein
LCDAAFDQDFVLQLRRVKLAGDILLDPQIVRFTFVLGQETRDSLGVTHDRTGNEISLLRERDDRSQYV